MFQYICVLKMVCRYGEAAQADWAKDARAVWALFKRKSDDASVARGSVNKPPHDLSLF